MKPWDDELPGSFPAVRIAEAARAQGEARRRRRQSRTSAVVGLVLVVLVGGGVVAARQGRDTIRVDVAGQPGDTPPTSVFRDDFSDRLSGWGKLAEAKGSIGYLDGTYRMTLDQPDRGTFAPSPSTSLLANLSAEVDVTKLSPGLGSFGVACRDGGGLRYSALVDINGTWRITRIESAGGQPRRLIDGTSDAILPSGTNKVVLECKGGSSAHGPVSLTLSVNGRQVGHVVDADGLAPGRVGLEVASGVEPVQVQFDNFVVRQTG